MKTKVELDPQVVGFVQSLAPEPRRSLRQALRALESGAGDLKPLEGDLAGYWRLRVGAYRLLVRFFAGKGKSVCRCVFAERRSIVYEVFADTMRQRLKE